MAGYIAQMRRLLGAQSFIHPAARILIENEAGDILFIRRTDNGRWGLPAGSLESGETIEACIRREVREETGLELTHLEVIGISSDPEAELTRYPNGDEIQYFVIEFFAQSWEGVPQANCDEVSAVQFLPIDAIDDLPEQEWSTFESLIYYRATGRIRVR